jgi:chemotaxis signal transduction protein
MSSEGDRASLDSPAGAPLLAFADHLLAAHKEEETRISGVVQQYVTFSLRDDELALPILCCREILRAGVITRIPEAPAHVRGVVNLRGRIVPAVDVRTCLGLDPSVVTARSRLVVVEAAGRLFALLVDRVVRILKVASSEITSAHDQVKFPHLVGVAKLDQTTILILDMEGMLLASPGMNPPTDKE